MSGDVMNFPNTWEEYEEQYGFNDTEQVYTNGSRLIQSFRVKQWLEHTEVREEQLGKLLGKLQASENSVENTIVEAVKGGFSKQSSKLEVSESNEPTWEQVKEYCFKRNFAIVGREIPKEYLRGFAEVCENAPSVIPKPKEGEWIIHKINGIPHTVECSRCHQHYDYEELRLLGRSKGCIDIPHCPNCGAHLKGEEE